MINEPSPRAYYHPFTEQCTCGGRWYIASSNELKCEKCEQPRQLDIFQELNHDAQK